MHIPAMNKLAELYSKINDTNTSLYNEIIANEILSNLWDRKIEEEFRGHYRFGKSA